MSTISSTGMSSVYSCLHHNKKITPRDLRPENFLLASTENDTEVKLSHFRKAQRTQGIDLTTQSGNPGYLAPEIIAQLSFGKLKA